MICTKPLLRFIFALCTLIPISHLKPLFSNCNRVPEGKIGRFKDTEDCTKWYYCIRGQKPLEMQCPKLAPYDTQLYYRPGEMECDSSNHAPSSCFPPAPPCNPPDCYTYTGTYHYEPTTSTTTELTTTARAPRPPKLDDHPDFEIDCQGDKSCGLFPNTYGSCDKYIVCVNGEKIEKNCNDGFLFDAKMKECMPSNTTTCWEEPEPIPHYIRLNEKLCPFHDNPASTPVKIEKDGIILQNPLVNNWGMWQDWSYCPAGMYATGMDSLRLYISSVPRDEIGTFAISFKCHTPGRDETGVMIESTDPNFPMPDYFQHWMCKGAVVGIRVNSVARNGRDEMAIYNVQAICSCSKPAYLPNYPEEGVWTDAQFCKKRQAVCGMQTQMQEKIRDDMYLATDHFGMTNLKVKCCDVPNPVDKCVPKEDRLLVRDCDNSKGDESRIFEFQAQVGVSYDYEVKADASNFYSSIGYSFDDVKEKMTKKIVDKLDGDIKKWGSQKYKYTWDDIDEPVVLEDVTVSKKSIVVKKGDKVELYQYIGRCDHFIIRTNKFLRHIKRGNSNILEEFEI